ncbi:MAG: hypothetical protein IKR76_02650 [Ruminococcus sp.]|nr:hypothetical protein [Ruminococcus sp.]
MQFKEGTGWKACYDEQRELYTAEEGGGMAYGLFEITKDIYDRLGQKGMSDADNERLIRTGRHLFQNVNDRCGPPYSIMYDENYETLAPWASVVDSGKRWSDEMTDAAVELFESEADNREQRRAARKKRMNKTEENEDE